MYDLKYTITGGKIYELDNVYHVGYKRFKITLSYGYSIYVYSTKDIIDLVDFLTKTKYSLVYDEEGNKNVIFRKHIIKIVEVSL